MTDEPTKAETRVCGACHGMPVHFDGMARECAICGGTGIDRYIKPALGLGASGVEDSDTAIMARLEAAIVEQAAEIERLTKEAGASQRQYWAELETAVAGRDELRGMSDRQAARIGALTVERDDCLARIERQDAEIERLTGNLDYLGKMAKVYQEMEVERTTERDELRAEVERLRDQLLKSLAECGADQAEAEKQVCALADELDEANARAERYEAAFYAMARYQEATAAVLIAAANAGLKLPVWPQR